MFSNASKGLAAPPESASHSGKSAFDGSAASRRGRDFHSTFFLEDGPMFDPCKIPGSRSLHERKLATWALLVGETHSSAVHAETRRRPHRGMLPDVHFSRAVPDYSRPSLVRRLFGLFRSGGGNRSADVPVRNLLMGLSEKCIRQPILRATRQAPRQPDPRPATM